MDMSASAPPEGCSSVGGTLCGGVTSSGRDKYGSTMSIKKKWLL